MTEEGKKERDVVEGEMRREIERGALREGAGEGWAVM